MGLERYQPTDKELESAERMMDTGDRINARIREKDIESIRNAGWDVGFEIDMEHLVADPKTEAIALEGTVKGHRLAATGNFKDSQTLGSNAFKIFIDGVQVLDQRLVKELFDTYISRAADCLVRAQISETDHGLDVQFSEVNEELMEKTNATARELLK